MGLINSVSQKLRVTSFRPIAVIALALSRPFRRFQVVRRLVDEAQLENPLGNSEVLPPIELTVATAKKDFRSAKLAIESCLKYSMNPISRVLIIVEDGTLIEAETLFAGFEVFEEGKFVPENLLRAINLHSPSGRQGWVLQQVIGLWASISSQATGNLVLDSDTIFIRPIAFLDGRGRQLLQFSHEYVPAYEHHARSIWGRRSRHFGLSYVTHYQLMQPDIVRKMFPSSGHLTNWISKLDKSLRSPIADYHSYGRFLTSFFPSRFVLGRWGNKSRPWSVLNQLGTSHVRDDTQDGLAGYYSVSVHTYLG